MQMHACVYARPLHSIQGIGYLNILDEKMLARLLQKCSSSE